ncbi:heparin lyase I family protein [Haliea sp. E17]|uniref:heparin lyase I family protein n=1 Tax=Haliea sp. E17 TaxID=3401576 RepID=UPI003AAD96EA
MNRHIIETLKTGAALARITADLCTTSVISSTSKLHSTGKSPASRVIRSLGAASFLVASVLHAPLSKANLDHEYDFESGSFDAACIGNCPTVSNEYSRSGRYAMQSTISSSSSNKKLTMAAIPGNDRFMEFERDYWIGFSAYLPHGWEVPGKMEAIATIHRKPDRGEKDYALFALYTGSGEWEVENRANGISTQQWTLNSVYEDVGRWSDFVIHYKPSYQSSGILEVWKDGALVAKRTGANTEKDDTGPYLRLGLYKGRYNAPAKSVYHDDLRIASGPYASYADVVPGGISTTSENTSGGDSTSGSDSSSSGSGSTSISDSTSGSGSTSSSDSTSGGDNTSGGTGSAEETHTFEEGLLGDLDCSGNCPQVSTRYSRSGNYAMESTITNNSPNIKRTEVTIRGAKKKMEFERDYWMGFSIFLPPGWEVPNKMQLVYQIHRTNDPGETGGQPPFAIYTGTGNWRVTSQAGSDKQVWDLNPVMQDVGRWVDWVVHYKPSKGNSGIVEVWKDGTLVASRRGQTTEDDLVGPYSKWGIYKGQYDFAPITVYHDDIRVSSGSGAGYQDVVPR